MEKGSAAGGQQDLSGSLECSRGQDVVVYSALNVGVFDKVHRALHTTDKQIYERRAGGACLFVTKSTVTLKK